jgi:hypothetical protein
MSIAKTKEQPIAGTIDKKVIQTRITKWKSVNKILKNEFVGIDKQIDQIMSSLKAWYVCPEYMNRPLIINLWGITGTFKTSIIRRIIALLDFDNRLVEIDTREIDTTSKAEAKLKESSKYDGVPHVFLFDEFQNVRTINEEGKEISKDRDGLSKFFSLINDGVIKYSKTDYYAENVIEECFNAYSSYQNYLKTQDPMDLEEDVFDPGASWMDGVTKENKDDPTGIIYFVRSQRRWLQKFYNINAREAIAMGWEELYKDLVSKRENMKIEQTINHRKSLIFICGNIDEAFRGLISELDSDFLTPDEFYEESNKINANDIKGALLTRFRAEQVARLGANHIIFPSFNNKMYQNLITSLNKKCIENFRLQTNKVLTIDPSIDKFLLTYSAIPSQGARSIISSHEYLVNSNVPDAILATILRNAEEVTLSIENTNTILTSGTYKTQKKIEIIDDKVLKNYKGDLGKLIALHEAGHAIVNYAVYGKHPVLIKARNKDSSIGGYCKTTHLSLPGKSEMVGRLAVIMAGYAAEVMINGEDKVTGGSSSDINKATAFATNMVKRMGLGNHIANSAIENKMNSTSYFHGLKDEELVEEILEGALLLAFSALLCYKEEHVKLSKHLETHVIVRTKEIEQITGLKDGRKKH